jgi:hypothetical protein
MRDVLAMLPPPPVGDDVNSAARARLPSHNPTISHDSDR